MDNFILNNKIELSICVSLGSPDMSVTEFERYASIFNLIEIREDLLSQVSHSVIMRTMRKRGHVIYTLRNTDLKYSKEERLRYYKDAIDNLAMYIDLELYGDADIIREVLEYRMSSTSFTKLVISYHSNYDVKSEILRDIITKMSAYQPNIYKIAVLASTKEAVLDVCGLYKTYPNENLVAFCMGAVGKHTRISCIGLGSPFTYACANGHKTALDQLNYTETKEILKQLYGDEQFWKSIQS